MGRREIDAVFMKMDEKKDEKLDLEEMYKVSQKLGENITKAEIKEMIAMFNRDYQAQKAKNDAQPADQQQEIELPTHITMDDFYEVMQMEILDRKDSMV